MNLQNQDVLQKTVQTWAKHIGVPMPRIKILPMPTLWGGMSTEGQLTLNTELVLMPKKLREYVIVHELVHLLVPNHGKVFKCFMSAYLPDWEVREKQLQEWQRG